MKITTFDEHDIIIKDNIGVYSDGYLNEWNIDIANNSRVQPFLDKFGYCIGLWVKGINYFGDNDISWALRISVEDYQKILIEKYNAFMYRGIAARFCTIENAYSACQWIQSIVIMNDLGGL